MNKLFKSFGYALKGIRSAIKSEMNLRIHLSITVMVLIAAIVLKISVTEWLICLLCIALVTSLELINTSIENIVDKISPEFHPLAGKAKDAAAGAVLVSALVSAIIGMIIFIPKLIERFF